MTADHLGSPRIVTDALGHVRSRHDYLAYGDEVTDKVGNVAGRTSGQGYGAQDDVRKQYTGYERDDESGLDFAQARYYNPSHGRYTGVDPMTASADVRNPQTFNRYSYVLNSPYKFTDPLGLISEHTGACGNRCPGIDAWGGGLVSQYQGFENSGTAMVVFERIYQREVRTLTVVQTENDGRQAKITVTVEQDRIYEINNGRPKLVETGNPNVTTSTATNTGSTPFSNTDLRTMEIVAKDIVGVAVGVSFDPTLALAMAQRETHLGIGAIGDPRNVGKPEMNAAINPLQLDGAANKKYHASATDRRYNISKSIALYREEYKNAASIEEKLQHYNDGTKIGGAGKAYATAILSLQRNISDKTKYVDGKYDRFQQRVVYPTIY